MYVNIEIYEYRVIWLKHAYKRILIVYLVMQLTLGFGSRLTALVLQWTGQEIIHLEVKAFSIWATVSFVFTLIFALYHLRGEFFLKRKNVLSLPASLLWAAFGILLVLSAQIAAIYIESLLGIEAGSDNTKNILGLIRISPVMIAVTSIIGPVLEEIVFRKIIFGTLYKRFNFFISALISSVIFSLAHMEPEHLLLYSAVGFTFSFLYVKTKRLLVPILTHVFMNSYVIFLNLFHTGFLFP